MAQRGTRIGLEAESALDGVMVERYAVTIDGAVRAVELEEIDGKIRIAVDGRERTVDARALGGGVWSVVDGFEARLLQIDGTGTKMTVEVSHPDGEPRICVAEVADARRPAPAVGAAAGAGGAGPLTLRAPIPGRVVKVLVKVSDAVKAGQTLLVLEAMKMENELRAPRAGVIATVSASEGIAVEAGQDLVSIA